MERSGLLREPAAGRVDFVHRTFQEYLAAKAAVDNDEIGQLVANAHDDQWLGPASRVAEFAGSP
jgi:predicted NACHT family NTPase